MPDMDLQRAVYGLGVLVAVGLVAFGGVTALQAFGVEIPVVTGALSAASGGSGGGGGAGDGPTGGVDTVPVADYAVDGDVPLPTSISSGDAYLFTEANCPKTDSPVLYGDYVDFSASEATSGLTEGVEYEKVSLSSSNNATFEDLDAGTYCLVLVDKSSPREYHYHFGKVTMPTEVAQFRVEQDQPVKLIEKSAFVRFPTYDTDSATVFDTSDEPQVLASNASDVNFDDPSTNTTERSRTVVREVTYTSGQDYLGKLVAKNFNADDGIQTIEVTVTADGEEVYSKTLYDDTVDEFGSDNAFSAGLTDEPDREPKTAKSKVEIEATITYDANTAVASADDSEIGPGESIVDLHVEDIYGNVVGDEPKSYIVG